MKPNLTDAESKNGIVGKLQKLLDELLVYEGEWEDLSDSAVILRNEAANARSRSERQQVAQAAEQLEQEVNAAKRADEQAQARWEQERRASDNGGSRRQNHTPHGYADIRILAVMHGKDVFHGNRFGREDPADRKAFCRFIRGNLVYNTMLTYLRTRKDWLREEIMNAPIPQNPPLRFDPGNYRHRTISTALSDSHKEWPYWNHAKRHGERGQQFLADNPIEENKGKFRLSLALLSEEHEDLSLRDLRVLCAFNSCVEGGFGQIHLNVLALRAVGAENEAQACQFDVRPLGEMQVRRALEELERKRLIQRLTIGRNTYGAAGSMPESVFYQLAAQAENAGKPKRGYMKDGKLHVVAEVADCQSKSFHGTPHGTQLGTPSANAYTKGN